MATVQTEIRLSVDGLLKAADRLSTPELEELVSRMLKLRARRRAPYLSEAPGLSAEETELLQRINEGLPPEVWERYHELQAKREAETLTPEEHKELIGLIDRVEELQANRLELASKLAKIRNTSLDALIQELGLRASDHG